MTARSLGAERCSPRSAVLPLMLLTLLGMALLAPFSRANLHPPDAHNAVPHLGVSSSLPADHARSDEVLPAPPASATNLAVTTRSSQRPQGRLGFAPPAPPPR